MELKNIGKSLQWLRDHAKEHDFDIVTLYGAREEFDIISSKENRPHIDNLEQQEIIHKQRRELAQLNEALRLKNRELDSMHYVWCDGGCGGGVHRFEPMNGVPLTEEIVKAAEANTRRLRSWFVNAQARKEYERVKSDSGQSKHGRLAALWNHWFKLGNRK
jgi:hypothetical protein